MRMLGGIYHGASTMKWNARTGRGLPQALISSSQWLQISRHVPSFCPLMSHFPETTRLTAGLMVSTGPEVSVPQRHQGLAHLLSLPAREHLLSLHCQGSWEVVQPLRNMKTGCAKRNAALPRPPIFPSSLCKPTPDFQSNKKSTLKLQRSERDECLSAHQVSGTRPGTPKYIRPHL